MKTKKNVTIGIIQQSPDMGGAETYMASLMSEFCSRGYRVHFATNLETFLEYVNEIDIYSYKIPVVIDYIGNVRGFVKSTIRLPYAFYYYTSLLIEFKKQGVEVILLTGFSEKMLVSFLSLFFRIPVVWIEYGSSQKMVSRLFYFPKLIYFLCKGIPKKIIASSVYARNGMARFAGLPKKKMKVVYCGVSISTTKRKEMKMNEFKNAFVIGNVSRLTREKGQDVLILAMTEILTQIPNAHLVLIGQGPDREYFKEIVKKNRLEKNVKIIGYVENLARYYDSMDVFVFPSVWELEGFGLVAAEAMMHKVPVIASDIGPIPEVVENKTTGILVKPGDGKEIAKSVIELYKNPEKRKKYGEKGYKRVIEKFDMKQVGDQFSKILNQAIREQ